MSDPLNDPQRHPRCWKCGRWLTLREAKAWGYNVDMPPASQPKIMSCEKPGCTDAVRGMIDAA